MPSPTTTVVAIALALSALAPRAVEAQIATSDADVSAIDSVATVVRRLGRDHGESVWPGFRPDTIPVVFVFPGRGRLLTGWSGQLPAGFTRLPDGDAWQADSALTAASTSTSFGDRPAAQVVVPAGASPRGPLDGAALASLAFHEAFHVLQGAARREGRRFGQGENAFYVASYPIFDVENEALFALEGRLLASALGAPSAARRRELARELVAVRRRRHARLMPEVASFDDASEMNEGLAQYAQLRALDLVRREGPIAWRDSAAAALRSERRRLDSLTTDATRSFRLRYYSTGPAIATLLDSFAGPAWKKRLLEDNVTLVDLLAHVVGIDEAAERAAARALAAAHEQRLRADAATAIAALRARRERQVDSVLALPGLRVIVTLDSVGRDWGLCGFDPQNHLQVTPTVQLQTRWWRPCAGSAASAEFGVPSVHDAEARTVSAVVGPESAVTLTAGGQPLVVPEGATVRGVAAFRLAAARVTVEAAHADVSREGRVLRVRVLP